MKITQFSTTADGGSHFEEIEIPLDDERQGADGYILMSSEKFSAQDITFVCLPEGLEQDWHPAPTRQLVQLITGSLEVTTTDNEVRRWGAGDVVIAADVTGRGHKTRVVGGPAMVMFVPIADDVLR